MKYRYKIMGLDCPNCALKIQEKLNNHPDFKNVNINFSTLTITYETNIKNSLTKINKLLKEIEPGVKIVDQIETKEYHLSNLITGLIIGIIGFILNQNILIYISYLILLFNPLKKASNLLIKNKTINENLLITISCLGALLINQKAEGIMVVSLYLLGKILEEKALNKTRNTVLNLLTLKQDYANLIKNNKLTKIPVDKVMKNDILLVKKGEKVPVDAIIIKGKTKFDTSNLTGEADLMEFFPKDKILSGFINLEEPITIKATTTSKNSTVSKILELTEEASSNKAKLETSVNKLSKIYTPIILILAISTYIILTYLIKISQEESLYRALTFLVIACPCAIAISVPLSYFIALGVASANGILIKGSNYLDNLRQIDKIIFDKTGTLTTGSFQVKELNLLTNKYTKENIIQIIRSGESFSNHPVAKAIMKLNNQKINSQDITNFQEIPSKGIKFNYQDKIITITNSQKDEYLITINSLKVATLKISDGIKENAKFTINYFNQLKIKTYMFTGDNFQNATLIGKKLNIQTIKANMLPTDKYYELEKLIEPSSVVTFVGDGINDSPVIKRASIGISMGGLGADIAINSSDIVIMNDDLAKIPLAFKISLYTNTIIKQNLIGALTIKALILILSIFGLTTMWFAVFADTGLTVLTILNSLRINQKFKIKK